MMKIMMMMMGAGVAEQSEQPELKLRIGKMIQNRFNQLGIALNPQDYCGGSGSGNSLHIVVVVQVGVLYSGSGSGSSEKEQFIQSLDGQFRAYSHHSLFDLPTYLAKNVQYIFDEEPNAYAQTPVPKTPNLLQNLSNWDSFRS